MQQSTLSRWLKFAIIGAGLCGLVIYGVVIPSYGVSMRTQNPEYAHCFWPWLIFLSCTAIPCYLALWYGWRIASNIRADRSFSMDNARLLWRIAALAAGDAAFFFVGNIVLLFLNMSHPGVTLLSLLAVFAGAAIAVAAACLSHLVGKAADLQEQSDLTI